MTDELFPGLSSTALRDPECPLPLRRKLLKTLVLAEEKREREELDRVLAVLASRDAAAAAEKRREAEELLRLMKAGPLRAALYLGPGDPGFGERRVRVQFGDNTEAQVAVPDAELAAELRRGDTVWVEAQGHGVLGRAPCGAEVGEIARIEKLLDGGRIAVGSDETTRAAWRLSAELEERLERGELGVGDEVVGCPVRRIAFAAVRRGAAREHYRFLEHQGPPAVDLERDVGAPHPFIGDLGEHVRTEMTEPELARSFGLGRSRSVLITGPAGTGKSLSIRAVWRLVYEVAAEVCGVPVEALPPRVLRMRSSKLLSMWLGQSDKNVDRLFDEARMLADDPFVAPDGRTHHLPVIVIGEEIEGLSRKRGHDAVHDRIQTTLLERFETSAPEWRDRLVIFLFTSNVPALVDSAMFRRAGGEHVRLGGLDRRGFAAVLEKQLRGRRLRTAGGASALAEELGAWVFSGADDPGQVELHFLGRPAPVVKHRRDLMTAALVHRAVERASQAACRAGRDGDPAPGLDLAALARALHDQVRAVVEHLDPSNAATYLDLPRDVQVRAVNPVRQPSLLALELERAATAS